jgi:hypothetical protein
MLCYVSEISWVIVVRMAYKNATAVIGYSKYWLKCEVNFLSLSLWADHSGRAV